jgi:hypothetical protein
VTWHHMEMVGSSCARQVGLGQLEKDNALRQACAEVALSSLASLCNMTKETGCRSHGTRPSSVSHHPGQRVRPAETAVQTMEAQEQHGRHRRERLIGWRVQGQSTPTPYHYLNTGGGDGTRTEISGTATTCRGTEAVRSRDSDRGVKVGRFVRGGAHFTWRNERAGRGRVAGRGTDGCGTGASTRWGCELTPGPRCQRIKLNPSPYITVTFGPSYHFRCATTLLA